MSVYWNNKAKTYQSILASATFKKNLHRENIFHFEHNKW